MAQDETLIETDVLGFALRPDTVLGELYFIAVLTVSQKFKKCIYD